MADTKFYISSEDGQLQLLDIIEHSEITLPKDDQATGDDHSLGPFKLKMNLKLDEEANKQLSKLINDFENEREEGIKACAKYCGVPEEEIRQMLEKVEKKMGARMIPKIKNPN